MVAKCRSIYPYNASYGWIPVNYDRARKFYGGLAAIWNYRGLDFRDLFRGY